MSGSAHRTLTLRSFVACGHRFVLWVYGKPPITCRRALRFRTRRRSFPATAYSATRQVCVRAATRAFPTYSATSYSTIAAAGGPTFDVVCLKPLDFDQWYAFHPHTELGLAGSVLKAPPRSEADRGLCHLDRSKRGRLERRLDEANPHPGQRGPVVRAWIANLARGNSRLADWQEGEKYGERPLRRRPNFICCTGATNGWHRGSSIRTSRLPARPTTRSSRKRRVGLSNSRTVLSEWPVLFACAGLLRDNQCVHLTLWIVVGMFCGEASGGLAVGFRAQHLHQTGNRVQWVVRRSDYGSPTALQPG